MTIYRSSGPFPHNPRCPFFDRKLYHGGLPQCCSSKNLPVNGRLSGIVEYRNATAAKAIAGYSTSGQFQDRDKRQSHTDL